MLKVRDIMTREPVTVSPELALRDAVDLLADEHISGAPVVAGGQVVGVVTAADVLSFQASQPGVPTGQANPERDQESAWDPAREWEAGREPAATFFTEMWEDAGGDVASRFSALDGPEWDVLTEHTVGEAMTRRLLTVSPDADVADAARYMQEAGVHRLLVMNHGRLEGIVTTADIVGAVARRRLS